MNKYVHICIYSAFVYKQNITDGLALINVSDLVHVMRNSLCTPGIIRMQELKVHKDEAHRDKSSGRTYGRHVHIKKNSHVYVGFKILIKCTDLFWKKKKKRNMQKSSVAK